MKNRVVLTMEELHTLCRMASWALWAEGITPNEKLVRDCNKWAARAKAAEAKLSAPSAWQPMETAPKDGRFVLLWHPDWSGAAFGSWTNEFQWGDPHTFTWPTQPTMWHPCPPLPPPPTEEVKL
jgi:hypothetical protein